MAPNRNQSINCYKSQKICEKSLKEGENPKKKVSSGPVGPTVSEFVNTCLPEGVKMSNFRQFEKDNPSSSAWYELGILISEISDLFL